MTRPRTLAALAAALAVLGGALGVSALFVPAVALAALALVAEASVRLGARGARVSLQLDTRSVEEERTLALQVRAGGWGCALARAELLSLPGGQARRVGPRGLETELLLRPRRRGEHQLGPAELLFEDPFGLCSRTRRSEPQRVLVLPKVERVPVRQVDALLTLGRARALRDEGPDVEGLRPYRPGAPAARIHWLTVARTRQLVERRALRDADGLPATVVLDAAGAPDAAALDMAVRAAASLCLAIAARGGCGLLLPGSARVEPVRPDLASWPALHEQLALVSAGAAPLWRVLERSPVVIWVGARTPVLERGGRAAVTVSPSPRPGPSAFQLCGCAVQIGLLARVAA